MKFWFGLALMVLVLTGCLSSTSSETRDTTSEEEPKVSSSGNTSSDSKIPGAEVTAKQILENGSAYEIRLVGANYSIDTPEYSCGTKPEWMEPLGDLDFAKSPALELTVADGIVNFKLQTRAEGELTFTESQSDLLVELYIITEDYIGELKNKPVLRLASKECAKEESPFLEVYPDLYSSAGELLIPKREFVSLSEASKYYSLSDYTELYGVEDCEEGLAKFLNSTSDDWVKRASVNEGKLLLEGAGSFISEDRESFSLALDDQNLEIVDYTNSGYWIDYAFEACGQELNAVFVIEPVTLEYWSDEL